MGRALSHAVTGTPTRAWTERGLLPGYKTSLTVDEASHLTKSAQGSQQPHEMSAAGLCLRLLVVTAAVAATAASGRFQVCGAHLVDTLRLVCRGVYNKAFSKKSLEGMQMDDAAVFWPPTREEQQEEEDGDAMDRPDYAHPQALFRGRASGRRRRRGVVDECCFRSCSLHEMRQYCG